LPYNRFDLCHTKVSLFHIPELTSATHTANEGPVRIQYKFLVSIYVFPELKLLFPKQKNNVLSPSSYTHISVRDLYISKIGLPILLQGIMWIDPGKIYIALRHMNVEIGSEAVQFPEKEYINAIFLAVQQLDLPSSQHTNDCWNTYYLPDNSCDLWGPDEELAVGGNVVVPGGGEDVLPGAGLGGARHVQEVLHCQLQPSSKVPTPTTR
jgi:hypothetical protein